MIPHRVTCCCVQFSGITEGLLVNIPVTLYQACEFGNRFEIEVDVLATMYGLVRAGHANC